MRNDIFIDNNVAKNFSNPHDPRYKKLVKWLAAFDCSRGTKNAHLVVSKSLLAEYYRTAAKCQSGTSIVVLVDKLTREGRQVLITKTQIDSFKNSYFTKSIIRHLRCNNEDRDHIAVVLLSDRKYALTLDSKLFFDLVNFPGFTAIVAKRPEKLPYDA